jgi:hypothetical protein
MQIKLTGRTPQSSAAAQSLVNFLETYGDVREEGESIFSVDNREKLLVSFSSQAYFEQKGYYWFSLAKTKYQQIANWQEDHAWMVLLCGWTAFSPRLKNQWYCEAHHVQPLGKKYGGPDHSSNILALCPTHHCMMDLGILAIEPTNLKIVSSSKDGPTHDQTLVLKREHGLNQKYLQYHLDKIFIGVLREIPIAADTP